MGVSIATTRFAAVDTGGIQDITIADFGTPKAVMFIWSYALADDTTTAHNIFGIGFTDGTVDGAMGIFDYDAGGTTQGRRYNDDGHCIMVSSTLSRAHASFNSWITNGIKINWDTTPNAAYLITAVFFGGTDLSADAHWVTLGNQDVEVNVESPGFEPDCLIMGCIGHAADTDGDNYPLFSLGVVANDGSATQRAILWYTKDSVGTSELEAIFETDRCCGQAFNGSVNWAGEVTDAGFDGAGYSIYSRGGNSGDRVLVLALNFNSVKDVYVGTMDTPTSTGNDAETGFGFQPDFELIIPTTLTAVDTYKTDGEAGVIAAAVLDATNQYCVAGASEDNQGTSDTQCITDDQAINVPEHDGTVGFEATLTSFDADGHTLNFSATLGTACKWGLLAIGEAAAPAGGVNQIIGGGIVA